MTESNHSVLGEGLRLYTDAMRRLVKQRLIDAYPNNWWEQGILSALSDGQRRSVNRELAKKPDAGREDLIDANMLVPVVTRKFDSVFEDTFHNFRQTQSWLIQVSEARNGWAHPRSGDVLTDEAAHALYAMVQLLNAAGLPEAEKVESLRRSILGIPPTPIRAKEEPVEASPVRPSRQGALPNWWEVCIPREGFRDPAHIDESLFAATLGGVFAGSARDEYLDPVRFLSHTYFTDNLAQMVRDIVSRMSGGAGPAVTEVQTPFGGGKTHALLTLYHLINSREASLTVSAAREALGNLSIPAGAHVLVFDGQEMGTEPILKEDGASVSSLWGALAHQVGSSSWMSVMDSDGRGEAPGNAVFRQVLEQASPCLILLDEIVSYLVKLRFSSVRRTQNLYRQTVQFLQETLQLASNVPGVCVLVSLPKSRREFGGLDPEQLRNELTILDELQPRADRVVSKRTPVNDEDIYVLMSRRLFESADADAAEQAARAYRQVYEKTPGLYDPAVLTSDYTDQMRAAYPLHPELIDVLYKKWSTAPDFPRTRATLQLLAGVVADQWKNQREAHTIQSAHVDLERERIRTRIVSAAGSGGGYDGVVAADIIGRDAHADMQDEKRGGDYARFHIARGVATTLLMHSFGGMERGGGTLQELRLGTVAPNVGPEYVTEILGSLEESLWYVHREGEALKFQTRPNIYRVIAQTADGQATSLVAERLRAEVERAIGAATGFRVLSWAGGDGQLPDNPEPAIAVLEPRYAVAGSEGNGLPNGVEKVRQLWDRVGGGLRQWRNALILVAPDQELWSKAEEAVREVLAYEAVSASPEAQTLSQAEIADLRSRGAAKKSSLRTSVATAYRWVFYPDEAGLTSVSLPVPATAGEHIASRSVKRLSDQDYGAPKVLPRMGAVYFNSKVAPRLWKDESGPLDLSEMLRRFPQWTYLPILPDREKALGDCLREGVGQKLWAVAIGDAETNVYRSLVETTEAFDVISNLFDGSASLVKGDLLDLIREELHPGTGSSSDETRPQLDGQPRDSEGAEQIKEGPTPPPTIPAPHKRLTRVKVSVRDLSVAKTSNLQPYLFRVLQEQDAGAEMNVTIEVSSDAGISEEALNQRIVEGFNQLGIAVEWQEE